MIAPAKTLNRFLTVAEVAGLAGVGVDTVRKAVYLTRAGEAKPGGTWYLPRKSRMRAGLEVGDALRWLEARGQLPREYQGALNQLG